MNRLAVACQWCGATVMPFKLQWHFVYQCEKCPPPEVDKRICSKCQQQQDIERFSPHPKGPKGRRFICMACCRKATAQWRADARNQVGNRVTYERPSRHAWKTCKYCGMQFIAREIWPHRARCPENPKNMGEVPFQKKPPTQKRIDYVRLRVLERYSLTPEQFDALMLKQGGKCAICGAKEAGRNRRTLHVDHNHVTGKVRGLLCVKCNQGIGQFNESVALFLTAITYLSAHTPLPTVS